MSGNTASGTGRGIIPHYFSQSAPKEQTSEVEDPSHVPCGETHRVEAEIHHEPRSQSRKAGATDVDDSRDSSESDDEGESKRKKRAGKLRSDEDEEDDDDDDEEEEEDDDDGDRACDDGDDGDDDTRQSNTQPTRIAAKARNPKRSYHKRCEFIDREAGVQGSTDHGADNDDEQGDQDSEQTRADRDFLDDSESQANNDPSFYREAMAVSRQREAESVEPYFPLAFAVSDERPLEFNFEMFFLDTLELPRHIVPRESEEEQPATGVRFTGAAGAIAYCSERLKRGWEVTRQASQGGQDSTQRLSHPGVDKERLFRRDGQNMTKSLKSGQAALDANLNRVRLDRFGNVMIWNAPQWSPASAQFTHGFPRRLIAQSHGGFLPGNMTVAAKASNLTLRRLAVCDVACLVSASTTAGAGLSRARLLNLRHAAVSYHRGSFCPQYLASAMVEYGVNFATFEAISADALDALYASLTRGWRQEVVDQDSSDSEGAVEPLIPCTFPQTVLVEMGKATEGEADGAPRSDSTAQLSALLARFSTEHGDDSSSDSEEGTEGEGGGSGQVAKAGGTGSRAAKPRTRKRKSAGSSSGNAKNKAPRSDAEPGGDAGEPNRSAQEIEADPWGLQGRLIPGLREDAIPEPYAWESLLAFFREHRPLSQEQILSVMPPGSSFSSESPETVQLASAELVDTARKQQLCEKLAALFAICDERCSCSLESCALKQGRFGQEIAEPDCPERATCSTCSVFLRHLDFRTLLARASASRGVLFSRLLASSVAVHRLYTLAVPPELPPDQRVARKQSVKELLCGLLDCERNRFQCVRRIGELALLLPQLLRLQMVSGRALFWDKLRKVANTVIGQASREAKLAALDAICRRLPGDSEWKAYLTPEGH